MKQITARFGRCAGCRVDVAGKPVMWNPDVRGQVWCLSCDTAQSNTPAAQSSTNYDHNMDLSKIPSEPKRERKALTPNVYQQDIFDWVQHGTGSAVVEAVAGSGKTTTIIEACYLMPEGASALFLAFNKNIADELGARLPEYIPASTFHSACLKALTASMPNRPRVDSKKLMATARKLMDAGKLSQADMDTYIAGALKLVSVAKESGIGLLTPDTDTAWENLVDHFDIQFGDRR